MSDNAVGTNEPGPVLDAGTFATLYALDEGHLLRRYRSGADAGAEARLLAHLSAHGVPVPRMEHLGGPDLRMERLHGPTLLQGLASGEVTIADGGALLADLLARLHAVPVLTGLLPAGPPGAVIAHLDLHPGNVVLSEQRGPCIVAWGTAELAAPQIDLATTALLVAEAACDSGEDYTATARALLAAFLHAAPAFDDAALAAAAARRADDPWLVDGERELIPAARGLVAAMLAVVR